MTVFAYSAVCHGAARMVSRERRAGFGYAVQMRAVQGVTLVLYWKQRGGGRAIVRRWCSERVCVQVPWADGIGGVEIRRMNELIGARDDLQTCIVVGGGGAIGEAGICEEIWEGKRG